MSSTSTVPPALHTRVISPTTRPGSCMWCSARRQTTTSKFSLSKGRFCASPIWNEILDSPFCFVRSSPIASIAAVKSTPITSRAARAKASAMYPGPVAISSTRSFPCSRADATSRRIRSSFVTQGFDANAFACVVNDSRTTSLCCVMIQPFQRGSKNNIVTESLPRRLSVGVQIEKVDLRHRDSVRVGRLSRAGIEALSQCTGHQTFWVNERLNSTKVMLSSVYQSRNVYFGGRNRDGRTVEMGFLLLLDSLFRANHSL